MNLEQLNQKLLAAARHHAPGDHVPFAFEKRMLARLAAAPMPDLLSLWTQALWRAAVPCLAVVTIAGVCSLFMPATNPAAGATSNSSTELTQDFENTLLASVDTSANSFEDAQ